MADGTYVFIENIPTQMFLTVDVNGIEKKTNKWGHDLFTFQVLETGKLVPMGSNETTSKENQYCLANSTNRMNGIGCTHKALTDKNYWKNLPK